MTMQVQILNQPHSKAPENLEALLNSNIAVQWGDPLDGEGEFQVLVASRPSLEQLEMSSKLHALVIPFAGIPVETRELLLSHFPNLDVYNLHHNAVATAEMAMALLLSTAKNIVLADSALRAHDWRIRYEPNENIILSGKHALVVGYGAVGRSIAQMCQAFGMEVHALRHDTPQFSDDSGVQVDPIDRLDSLLPRSDVIFIALPLTPRTEGMLNAERIAKLQNHCIVVNVARGPIINEQALYEALKLKTIAGAGLDVWYRYPEDEVSREHTPPATHPFHELDNVVMSPHRAGGSRQNESLRLQHLAQVINALARGDTHPTKVDVEAGY